MKKLLTIFTPSYNRAYTIHKCYESLKRQSCKEFEWLVIDDGSSDNTRELIEKWIKETADFKIRYIYQENQGMHGAHNTAYENITTELNVCIDSDDYMPDNAVEKIKEAWEKVRDNEKISGIIGLDAYEDGKVIGDRLPENIKTDTLFDLAYNKGIIGDKKLVYRSELTKKYPYPVYRGEKYVGLAYKYYKLDQEYELALMNEVLCIVEYMEDGSSLNMFKQYMKNPRGFAFYRIENMKNPKGNLRYKFKECIHYVSSSLILKNKEFLKETPLKLLTLCAMPFGIVLYFYIKKKAS
ncbi:glycosyltransferase family A protein [Clostridium sp. D53t1_180928_C8]|uniref:glycosyltransferase family 2 protein n=1 Tax=Clostridium sp. D53t1_180928_C8 TaxID=2787101 RepID=UPI0018AC0373|nr:glycosyltransferase family A protein [Clostridium sp. D53t1_180928_C8]